MLIICIKYSQGKRSNAAVFDTYDQQSRAQQPIPAGLVWDPYERPDHIGELRAGKNASTFSWSIAGCDEGKVFNLDRIMEYSYWTQAGPYTASDRIGTGKRFADMDPEVITTFGAFARNQSVVTPPESSTRSERLYADYTVPNWANMPIVPNVWAWHEIKTSIADFNLDKAWQKIDKYWCGTEHEQVKYPPSQFFCKGIPIYDATGNLIRTLTQVSVKISLELACKPRRSAYYCPTWGPFSGEQLYYHNPTKQIFQENLIRYRTAGGRRTWQNINRTNNQNSRKIHGREDCYDLPTGQTEITSNWYTSSSYPIQTTVGAGGLSSHDTERSNRDNIEITIDKQGTSTVRYTPAPKQRTKPPSPEKYADVQMLEQFSQM